MATAQSIQLMFLPSSDSFSFCQQGSPILESTSSLPRTARIRGLLLTRPLRITTRWSSATLSLRLQSRESVPPGAENTPYRTFFPAPKAFGAGLFSTDADANRFVQVRTWTNVPSFQIVAWGRHR